MTNVTLIGSSAVEIYFRLKIHIIDIRYQSTKKNNKLNHSFIIAYNKVMLALRTEVAIRMRRTTAIDVRMATSMIKVIRTVTTRR